MQYQEIWSLLLPAAWGLDVLWLDLNVGVWKQSDNHKVVGPDIYIWEALFPIELNSG